MEKILALLEEDAKLTAEQIAAMLGMEAAEVSAAIAAYEKAGVIKGYKALIDWDKAGRNSITSIIEVKVTPQRDFGFEQVAERIMRFDEVSSVYLMPAGSTCS